MWMEAQEVVVSGTDWSSLLIAVLSGAVGGAVVSGLFSVWKSRVEAKSEHAKWLREKRYEAYVTVLQAVYDIVDGIDDDDTKSRLTRARTAVTEVRMIAPESLKPMLDRFWEVERKHLNAGDDDDTSERSEMREEFREGIRKALKLNQP